MVFVCFVNCAILQRKFQSLHFRCMFIRIVGYRLVILDICQDSKINRMNVAQIHAGKNVKAVCVKKTHLGYVSFWVLLSDRYHPARFWIATTNPVSLNSSLTHFEFPSSTRISHCGFISCLYLFSTIQIRTKCCAQIRDCRFGTINMESRNSDFPIPNADRRTLESETLECIFSMTTLQFCVGHD